MAPFESTAKEGFLNGHVTSFCPWSQKLEPSFKNLSFNKGVEEFISPHYKITIKLSLKLSFEC